MCFQPSNSVPVLLYNIPSPTSAILYIFIKLFMFQHIYNERHQCCFHKFYLVTHGCSSFPKQQTLPQAPSKHDYSQSLGLFIDRTKDTLWPRELLQYGGSSQHQSGSSLIHQLLNSIYFNKSGLCQRSLIKHSLQSVVTSYCYTSPLNCLVSPGLGLSKYQFIFSPLFSLHLFQFQRQVVHDNNS